jgi:hypothetical protein
MGLDFVAEHLDTMKTNTDKVSKYYLYLMNDK